MAQNASSFEATQRIFVDLKSKNEEIRVRASYELYDNVATVSRGSFPSKIPFYKPCPC